MLCGRAAPIPPSCATLRCTAQHDAWCVVLSRPLLIQAPRLYCFPGRQADESLSLSLPPLLQRQSRRLSAPLGRPPVVCCFFLCSVLLHSSPSPNFLSQNPHLRPSYQLSISRGSYTGPPLTKTKHHRLLFHVFPTDVGFSTTSRVKTTLDSPFALARSHRPTEDFFASTPLPSIVMRTFHPSPVLLLCFNVPM
ncbi:uncharacterized protein BKA78DRAFT_5854 [Phyllosticta capitalensis]|uniref:uncharacterized protein n=1 Tax=Phyllosticta capitalensis TaxID=121624 RepID=UPI0031322EB7